MRNAVVAVMRCDRCLSGSAPSSPVVPAPGWGRLSAGPLVGRPLATQDNRTVFDLCPKCLDALAAWLGPLPVAARRKAA